MTQMESARGGPQASPATAQARGFGYGEHLFVWSWRRLLSGQASPDILAGEFTQAFGEESMEVFQTFCAFVRALEYASRRPLTMGAPGSEKVTRDERLALALVAAAQADTPARFEAQLRWLTHPDRHHVLLIAARALACALKEHDLRLVLPEPGMTDVCERARAVA